MHDAVLLKSANLERTTWIHITSITNTWRTFTYQERKVAIDTDELRHKSMRERDQSRKRHWLIENTSTGEGYLIKPGTDDGHADAAYGVGDMWILRMKESEIDDGGAQVIEPNANGTMAKIDYFADGEAVHDHDIVVWYAGHYHQTTLNLAHSRHIMGPDLIPANWM